MPSPADALTALVHDTLALLIRAAGDTPPTTLTASAEDRGWVVLVTAYPIANRALPLSEVERDILAVLASQTAPWPTARVARELEKAGHVHGLSTVARSLARLVRAGLLVSQRHAPRGYRRISRDCEVAATT